MTFKIIEFILLKGSLFMVSPVDCVAVDKLRYASQSEVVSVIVHDKEYIDLATAWHKMGKMMESRKWCHAFIPNRKGKPIDVAVNTTSYGAG